MMKEGVHVSLDEAIDKGPPPQGNLATPIYQHGSMVAELYRPIEQDPQSPHERDEIYVVAKGSGSFYNGKSKVHLDIGSFIFVPAGVEHRFEEFTEDFTVWVFFYGPKGGEESNA